MSSRLDCPEFFNIWVIASVVLFSINNFYLKAQFANWFTGKLSDLLVCFFLPLFISAILALFQITFKWRLAIGIGVCALTLTLLKTSPVVSSLFSHYLSQLNQNLGFGASHNLADPTDLIALPILFFTYKFALLHGGSKNEPN